MRLVLLTAALLGLVLPTKGAQASEETPASAQQAEADSYLRYWLIDAVFSSGEIDVARNALGVERTCALIRPAFEVAMGNLSPEWLKLYASITAEVGRPGALGEGNNGDATEDQRMMLLGLGLKYGDLIEKHAAEVREVALLPALEVSDDAIDYEARKREIDAARDNGRLLCGFGEGPKRQ